MLSLQGGGASNAALPQAQNPTEWSDVVYGSDGELMVAMDDSEDVREKDWVLDAGCSFHFCGYKEDF